jgi:hypothetical protein
VENNLLPHIIEMKERLARIEEGVQRTLEDSAEHKEKIRDLELSHMQFHTEMKTEREITLRSAKGYTVILSAIISAIIGGILKYFGNH